MINTYNNLVLNASQSNRFVRFHAIWYHLFQNTRSIRKQNSVNVRIPGRGFALGRKCKFLFKSYFCLKKSVKKKCSVPHFFYLPSRKRKMKWNEERKREREKIKLKAICERKRPGLDSSQTFLLAKKKRFLLNMSK